ncbi:DinB family protein [Streptomyces fagopyri]|uniref:DinB family protein n=1 Tax=Streptomyces fagopyri TaxID=2662397 RepID=UPI0037159A9F
MTTTERPMPPLDADERTTLESWLDFYRTTLVMKCEGLSDEQVRHASVVPSPLTLLGLVQHMAEVERNWFRRVLTGEEVASIYDPQADPHAPDGGFDLNESVSFTTARATWEAEIAQARTHCAARELDGTSPFMGGHVTLRWIYLHMIAEYARHNGHADLIRERIDGSTGV